MQAVCVRVCTCMCLNILSLHIFMQEREREREQIETGMIVSTGLPHMIVRQDQPPPMHPTD